MNRSQNGFTLIEILVVVAILGVLMGLVSLLVVQSGAKKQEMMTKMVVQSYLPVFIDKYKDEFKRLPPMNIRELTGVSRWKGLGIAQQNTTNECNECLLVALRHPDFSSPLGDGDLGTETPFGNMDDDIWNKVPDGSSDEIAWEILDAWGSPVVYIHKNHYKDPVRIINFDGEEIEVMALQKPNGTYYNPDSYQIISVGKDGKQDEETEKALMNDITNFKILED